MCGIIGIYKHKVSFYCSSSPQLYRSFGWASVKKPSSQVIVCYALAELQSEMQSACSDRQCLLQGPVNIEIYEGLLMLQHRGQDSAGMVTLKNGKFIEYKANGLVKDVFNNTKTMDKLQGKPAVFHD